MRACWVLALLCGCTADNTQVGDDGGGGDVDLSVQVGDDLAGVTGGGDLAGGGGPDLKMNQDLAGVDLMGVFVCGSNVCGTSQTCCVTSNMGMLDGTCVTGACADGGVPVACVGPPDCNGDPCCMTIANSLPTKVVCTTSATACAPNINVISKSGDTRICRTSADCTSGPVTTNYPDCCTYVANGVHMCFNKGLMGATGGTITCP